MKSILEDGKIKLEASDWRYSAAILGLIRYFDYNLIDYEIVDNSVIYSPEEITKERYVEYILERYKNDNFPYLVLTDKLNKDTYTDEEINDLNKYIKNCPISIKKLNLEFNGSNQKELLQILEMKKEELVLDIFKNRKRNGYAKFCNKSCFFKNDGKICRVNGYYVDIIHKKNLFMWSGNPNTFDSDDIQEFDFIPFGFSLDNDSLFINNNLMIKSLIADNSHFNSKNNIISLYKYIVRLEELNIRNNIEIIMKNIDKNYFQTVYIDKSLTNKLKEIHKINNIVELQNMNILVNKNYYINMNYILQLIFNHQNLDSVIHILLKNKQNDKTCNYYLKFIIQMNIILYGKTIRTVIEEYETAYSCAKKISKKISNHDINNAKQQLISAIIIDNKEHIYNCLLKISNYVGINISFMFDILDDYEKNKNQIYAFIIGL